MKNKGFTYLGLMIVISILEILVISLGINTSPGTGEGIGQVVKLSRWGMISKTWEGELICGGMSGGNGSFRIVPLNFTVETGDMAQRVQEYMQNQTEVVIKYQIEGVYFLFRSESSGHFLTSIEPAKKSG